MGTDKQKALRIIEEQPEDTSYEEIIRELVFARTIERGLADSDGGRTLSTEELEQRVASWVSITFRTEPPESVAGVVGNGRRTPMARVKDQVIERIRGLPEESSIEDIMAELYFRLKVDSGRKELDEGKGIPHAEVKERLSRWLAR